MTEQGLLLRTALRLQCVITPAAPYFPWTNEMIAAETDKQVCVCGGRGLHVSSPCYVL